MQNLAPELLVHIFESLSSVADIVSLSLACRYFHDLLPKSQKLVLFFSAVDQEMGPVDDIVQLLTQNDNQMLHVPRSPSLSFTLLSQATAVARVAQRFVSLYPEFRWLEAETASRRLLDPLEARRLRRAVYRFWIYAKVYQSHSFRISHLGMNATSELLQLLRTWSTNELFELEDFRCTLEQILVMEICPTDGEVYSRVPDDSQSYHLSLQHPHLRPYTAPMQTYGDLFYSSRALDLEQNKPSMQELRFRHMQGWGSDLQNFYLVQSFLKFTPAQILWLFENAVCRADVERFIEQQTHDTCFFESGSSLFQNWVTVLHARGVDVQQAREAIWDGKAGIVSDVL